MNKRIILTGPSASGKTYLRTLYNKRGFTYDVSYTSREPREGEIDGHDYHFISKEEFETMLKNNQLYEYVEYNGNQYGTGQKEWDTQDLFIMEADGIKHISEEDRKTCFIIFIDTPYDIRIDRMLERGWDNETINKRLATDEIKFHDFNNYDIRITNVF